MDLKSLLRGTSAGNSQPDTPQMPRDNVYHLPISQTVIQKELTELVVQLHRPHLLKILDENDSEIDMSVKKSPEYLDDESLLELFVSNLGQICNHSSLLVNHFVSKNLLLMDSKERIKQSSYKYIKIDEILNKLMDQKQSTTVIINSANSRELDLIETVLIGKKDLQYYRFSGASIYYDNHGSFDFNKQQPIEPETEIKPIKARGTKSKTRKPSKNRTDNSSSNSSKSTEAGNGKNGNGSSHNGSKNGEEYTSKISKNNPLFQKAKEQNSVKVVSVYLILSNQLKSLVKFEELKSDLIISLDSKLESTPELSIPILKPVCVNAVEYLEMEIGRQHPQLSGFERNKMLACLAVTRRGMIHVEDKTPVDQLVNWLGKTQTVSYPFDLSLPPLKVPSDLKEQTLQQLQSFGFEDAYLLQNYEYFNDELRSEVSNKKTKPNGISESLFVDQTYRDYELRLANAIYNRFNTVSSTVIKNKELLETVHLDDSERQVYLETVIADIGDKFTKLQGAKTMSANLVKQSEKCSEDVKRFQETQSVLKDRLGRYEARLAVVTTDDELERQDIEIAELEAKLSLLTQQLEDSSAKNEALRLNYQTGSSRAAELSSLVVDLKREHDRLNVESQGTFKKLKEIQLDDEVSNYRQKTAVIDKQNTFLENYIRSLEGTVKDKMNVGRVRASRSSTPYQ